MKRKEDVNKIIEDWNETSISGYTGESELKSIVKLICTEINNSSIIESELASLLVDIPTILAFEILYNTKFRDNKEIQFLLDSKYFDNFVKDVNKFDKKGISNFEKRYINQKNSNVNNFIGERLLVKHEIEILLSQLKSKDDNLKSLTIININKYNGDNKYVLALRNANLVLGKKQTINHELMTNITKRILEKLLENIKSLNVACDYE